MFLQSLSTAAMEKATSALWQRMQLISTNIANQDTPGYKAKRLDFESALQSELANLRNTRAISKRQAAAGITGVTPAQYEETRTVARADGNNVDILAEQAELARTQFQYQALTQKVNGYYSTLKYAISGGR